MYALTSRGRSRGNFCGLAMASSARKSPAMQKTRSKTRSLNMPDRQRQIRFGSLKLPQFHHASSLNCVNPIYSARLADSTFLEEILVILISRPVLTAAAAGLDAIFYSD